MAEHDDPVWLFRVVGSGGEAVVKRFAERVFNCLVHWYLTAAFEGEFCDAGLVEFAFAHVSELGVLIESSLC